jgi:hypothetical protein
VIAVAVRWYVRYGLSYRDVEELLGERGIEVDHVTVYRWVQTFTSEFIDAARPSRHTVGDRWFVDEVRHEALRIRVGVRDLHRRAVAAGRWQCDPGEAGEGGSSPDNDGTGRYCQAARAWLARQKAYVRYQRYQYPSSETPARTWRTWAGLRRTLTWISSCVGRPRVGDTGIEPVTPTVSTLYRRCWLRRSGPYRVDSGELLR